MMKFSKTLHVIFFTLFLGAAQNLSAMQSVNVDGIDVPIMTKSKTSCSKVKSNRINIIYIDDTSPVYQRSDDPIGVDTYNQVRYGDDDPNGVQDLVLILALAKKHSNKINLIGIGSSNRDINGHNHKLLRDTVNRLVPNLGVEVWKEPELVGKIAQLANCPNAKSGSWLRVAMGGEWIKLKKALDSDTRDMDDRNHIRFRIFATLLGGHNIRSSTSYYDGNPLKAKTPVENYLGQCVRYWKPGLAPDSFRNVYHHNFGESDEWENLNNWYSEHLKPHLRKVVDPLNHRLDSNESYEYKVLQRGYNDWGSRLRIADFLSVAEWIWPRSEVNKKSFILPKLEAALAEL